MQSDPEIHADKEQEQQQGKTGRVFTLIVRWAFWLLIIVAGWGLLASMMPGIAGPGAAMRSLLRLAKNATDEVYFWAKEESLEKAAEHVRESAVEHGPDDTTQSDLERLSDERRARLPVRPLLEDSTLQQQLSNISSLPPIRGRLINILIIGIDSRLSARDARADALHLVTINPDSAVVEIMSIPRDTYVDLGYPDTTSFNIIANAKLPGNGNLMRKVSDLAKRGPVNYYIEVGFSQAMGILEILGYKEPVKTLQFLRTRRTLPGGDIQRAHNQAVFMRQNLIDKFPLLTGGTGDLIISSGLNFLTTNLTREFCLGMVYNLEKKGFPHHRADAVRLRMLSGSNIRLKQMVADSATVNATLDRVQRMHGDGDDPNINVTSYLRRVNLRAMKDSARPGQIVHRLRRLNEQHAWLQIQDQDTRIGIRDTLTGLLEFALRKVGNTTEADAVRKARDAEDLLIRQQLLRK
ncbi:MAG: LCP family protein [Bacteroidetes bacterium]|nr:LCP family protein [Bacteroidota bacterium]